MVDRPHDRIRRVTRALARDILATSDEEILAAASERSGDVEAAAHVLGEQIDAALMQARKSRLAEARRALAAGARGRTAFLDTISLERMKAVVAELKMRAAGLPQSVTYAFREGRDETENDLRSLMQDLLDLGLISEKDLKE